jgi:lysophospholipase L1-like esterase
MTFDPRRFADQHQVGVTMVLTGLFAVLASAPPIPAEWAALDFVRGPEGPLRGLAHVLFSRPGRGGGGGGAAAAGDLADAVDAAPVEEEPVKDEVLPDAPRARGQRRAWTPPERSRYEEMRAKVGAAPRPVVIPCVETNGEVCSRSALDRFFARLGRAEDGEPDGIVRVVHFGDSLIASDHITDLVRQRLHERFGSAGRGTLFVDRLSRFAGRRVRTGVASEGWRLDVITMSKPIDRFFGYTGASFTAEKGGENTVFDVGPNRFVEVMYLRTPDGGQLEAQADGQKIAELDTRGEASTESFAFELPAGTQKLKLVAKTKNVRIYGVALEARVPGVVYESLGLPGATAKVWLHPDEASFASQLAHRDPALIVTMLGGNDGLMLSKKRTTIQDIEANTRELVARLRRSAPGADCLMVSPMDAARVSVNGGMVSKPEVEEVRAVLMRVADAHGCAFWDMWTSMGGTGALERWWNAKMINPDMIHPMGYGGDLLGELMVSALMDAYDRWHQGGQPDVVVADPVVLTLDEIPIRLDDAAPEAAGAGAEAAGTAAAVAPSAAGAAGAGVLTIPDAELMAPFFDKLTRLEREKVGRAAISVFGSTSIASQRFTDEVRLRLAQRFGDRGRGFVSAGRGAKALAEAGVERALTGAYELREGAKAGRVGMAGVRADLKKSGRFRFAPCTRDCPSGVGSLFDLFFLADEKLPDVTVRVSGLADDALARSVAPRDEGALVRRYTTRAANPELAIEVSGQGAMPLLGVVHELDRPGVVVEAVAASGASPQGAIKWDQDVVVAMLAKREVDLLVLAYGDVEGQAEAIDAATYRRELSRWLRRLRVATDDGPCLIVGPQPGLREKGGRWRELGAIAEVERVQREIALEEGCAFWDTRRALGGETAVVRWVDEAPQRLSLDRRSLSDEGVRIAAGLFVDDLLKAYGQAAGRSGTSAN